MIKMKIAIVFTICLTASSLLFAQRADDMLSKEEMNKEFDYLIELVSEVNPHLPIYKQMMGLDVIKEMKKQRKYIDEIENWATYFSFLSSVIRKIPELHTKMLENTNDYYIQLYPYLSDTIAKLNEARVNRDVDKLMLGSIGERLRRTYKNYNIILSYIDGKFYNIHGVKIRDEQTNEEQYIRSGWELTRINGVHILKFMYRNRYDNKESNRWDMKNRILYNRAPTSSYNSFYVNLNSGDVMRSDLLLTFLKPSGEEIVVKYAAKDSLCQPFHCFAEFEEPEWKWIDEYTSLRNKVIYFDSTLYVKILGMNMNSTDLFREEICRYKEMPLNKVVIDVRNNGGGSDQVWHDILSMIIDTTFCYNGRMGIANSDVYKNNRFLLASCIGNRIFDSLEIYKDHIMEKTYRLLSDGTDCIEIVPDSSSLRYKGQIYLLHNRGSFSSSTAFLTFALGEERVVAVGEHNGCLGGYGVSPFVFQLPYSKLAFVMHSTIHIPDNAKSVEDYFWNKTEVEVTTTPEWEVLMYINKDFFTPEILKTKDPFFKKVMELR